MASSNKHGKKPLSQKPQRPSVNPDEAFGNPLSLDDELKKELAEQGLVPRFVDSKHLYEMNGYHSKGWVPYKRKNPQAGLGFKFGNDPEGIIRRGSLILAVKSVEQVQKHKAFLEERAQRYMGYNKQKAEELRAFSKENNLPAEIHEGFEENDEDTTSI